MEKNKSLYVTLVVVFCVILSGISGFFLGTNFVNDHKTPIKNNETKENNEEKVQQKLMLKITNNIHFKYYITSFKVKIMT